MKSEELKSNRLNITVHCTTFDRFYLYLVFTLEFLKIKTAIFCITEVYSSSVPDIS